MGSYIAQSIGKWKTDWTPTFTGFSSIPTLLASRYCLDGKKCTVYFAATSGTSNATTKTITLPFPAANTNVQTDVCTIVNNGTGAHGRIGTRVNSVIADVYSTPAAGTWTASGTANIQISSFTYEIA